MMVIFLSTVPKLFNFNMNIPKYGSHVSGESSNIGILPNHDPI